MTDAGPIARQLELPRRGVEAVLRLVGDGNTVPFIARYRKEATGGLDEVAIRAVAEAHEARVALEKRRATVLAAIEEQGQLTDALRAQIAQADATTLEDLYLPFKRKRTTRAGKARQRGLEPLAERILAQPPSGDPAGEAAGFVSDDVPSAAEALAGARDIVAEVIGEDPRVRADLRQTFAAGRFTSTRIKSKTQQKTKYEQYYAFAEPLATIPSHRFLAIERGVKEGFLRAKVAVDEERLARRLEDRAGLRVGSPFAKELQAALADGTKRLYAPSAENEVRREAKERADQEAVEVFAANLRALLLAPPLGPEPVLGIDPGLRTGCKCAAVAATGKFLATVTIFPRQGDRAWGDLLGLIERHAPAAIAVGNGTGGRETEAFVRKRLKEAGRTDLIVVQVNEAGASVYSASDVARAEFPDLDLTIRGAISIARRLQDPLAELVKVEPKAIGVGQYQHDVQQSLLAKKLAEVVEDCVNAVGVDLNTASAPLLAHVAGLGPKLAERIVAYREEHGAFRARKELLKVKGLGKRAYEQAAGFLRVRGGEQPLDASAVHPERYALVEQMAADLGVAVGALVGAPAQVARIELGRYVDGELGLPTLEDIAAELKKPGRDPREAFEPPQFRDDVHELTDLEVGMKLEGVVTNVTPFGAFVDVGVHQDGLVHISKLADRFVRDPHEVVRVGDKLTVRVLDVDLERRRISLSSKPSELR